MKAGIGIRFPAIEFEVQSAFAGDVAVYFLDYAGNEVTLGLNVARRCNNDTQYANLIRRQRATPQRNVWGPRARELREYSSEISVHDEVYRGVKKSRTGPAS